MAVITITGHMGALGAVPTRVAEAMGYRLVDRELVIAAAELMGQREQDLMPLDERTGGFVERVIDMLQRIGSASVDPSDAAGAFDMTYGHATGVSPTAGERYFQTLRTVITRLADEGDIVIVGRGGQGILADRDDAFHVRVVCPVEDRIARIAERDHLDIEVARERVLTSDRNREDWHKRYLNIDYRSPYHYGLIVNTGVLRDGTASDLIVEAARTQLEWVEARA